MTALTEAELDCLRRYVARLEDELGTARQQVWLFGSAARGEMWADFWPMHSDIDLLVITADDLGAARQEGLANLTYPLYLECGRQIAPVFRTRDRLPAPLQAGIEQDGRRLWPRPAATVAA